MELTETQKGELMSAFQNAGIDDFDEWEMLPLVETIVGIVKGD